MASGGRSWFVFLGTVLADIAFEWTVEVTTFQTQEMACAKAGDRRLERSGSRRSVLLGGRASGVHRGRSRLTGTPPQGAEGCRKSLSLSCWGPLVYPAGGGSIGVLVGEFLVRDTC